MSLCHYKLGIFETARTPEVALKHLQRAIELDPNSNPAYLAYADFLLTSFVNKPPTEEADRYVPLNPSWLTNPYLFCICSIYVVKKAKTDRRCCLSVWGCSCYQKGLLYYQLDFKTICYRKGTRCFYFSSYTFVCSLRRIVVFKNVCSFVLYTYLGHAPSSIWPLYGNSIS